jgi:hypothetical protein
MVVVVVVVVLVVVLACMVCACMHAYHAVVAVVAVVSSHVAGQDKIGGGECWRNTKRGERKGRGKEGVLLENGMGWDGSCVCV